FVLYGCVSIVHGFLLHRGAIAVVINFAFNYYPLYLIIGVAVAQRNSTLMPTLARWLGWIHGIYGVCYVGGLHNLEGWSIPGSEHVPFFSQPDSSAFSILALLAYEPRLGRAIIPILLNLAVMGAVQVR